MKILPIKKKNWRPIYEVIDNCFCSKKTFPTEFLEKCKNNQSKPQNIPSEVKVALKKMDMEQGLYEQVVIIQRKDSENKKGKEKTKKYNFQGQSARSRHWFDLDHEWLEENFMTRKLYLYKKIIKINLGVMIQKHIKYFEHQLVMQKQQKV